MSNTDLSISRNVDLADLATMHVSAKAGTLIEIHSIEDLQRAFELIKQQDAEFLILGGGSNILFVDDFDGVILNIKLKGISIIEETEDHVLLKIAAGENWHELVMYCVSQGWGGIENLALIPGKVGAAPIQNIGAYGAELSDVLVELDAWMIETQTNNTFSNAECKFGYRESVFKSHLKGKVVITSLTIRLAKNHIPNFEYGALKAVLESRGITKPSIKQVCEAVIEVRQSKLPDPNELGNNGSFFKNPVIDVFLFNELKQKYPNIPGYPVTEHQVKVPAGWLIDQAGWKGYREGDAGVHKKQALVLVNYGNATGQEMYDLSERIKQDIRKKFGIELVREVNIV
ncbi:MAG: UDP-N-acetylmuramate dehydrogenase [Balneolaceae bacterium]|nr:UDP-N-acetylmuramate dehydrogenase [Balneolaceae bacterium]